MLNTVHLFVYQFNTKPMFRMPFSDTKRATITAADTPGGRCHRPARNETDGTIADLSPKDGRQQATAGRSPSMLDPAERHVNHTPKGTR